MSYEMIGGTPDARYWQFVHKAHRQIAKLAGVQLVTTNQRVYYWQASESDTPPIVAAFTQSPVMKNIQCELTVGRYVLGCDDPEQLTLATTFTYSASRLNGYLRLLGNVYDVSRPIGMSMADLKTDEPRILAQPRPKDYAYLIDELDRGASGQFGVSPPGLFD